MGAGRELTVARIRVTYRDPSTPADEISLGAFAQIAAKRRFGLDVAKSEDPEVVYFGAFVELVGPAKAKDPDAFDEWLVTVEGLDILDNEKDADPANPPPAETPSSDTSPESPPTSE